MTSPLLPAALEFQSDARRIDEQRPHWIGRSTVYTLVGVIVTAITWGSLAKVDRIVVAPGKLITTTPTIIVQPLETSVVRTLDARVGDIVKKGQQLATLDPTFSEADAASLRDKLISLDAQIERLTAELDEKPYRATTVDQEAQLQMAIWTRATQEYEHRLDAFDQQIEHTQAEVATKKADQASLAQRLLVARELEAMRSYLVEREVGSKVNYLDAKSQRMAVERDMQEDQNRILELGRELKQHQAEKAAYLAQFHAKVGEDLVQARRDRDAAAKQLEKAKLRNEITVLAAPADAVVLDIAKRSVGSVLKEAEPLYTLVPLASPLEAEVAVEATDVGHVEVGAEARVKLAAWPFQKYGTLSGRVQTVTEDSFAPEQSAKKEQPDSSEPQKPYYKARVELTSLELRDVPKNFRLLPGLAVSAEIKAGDRSVLSYFLYPILRNLDESIREP